MESFSNHILFLHIWDLYFCTLQQRLSSSSSDNHTFSYIYIFYLISLLKISSIVVLKLNHASEFLGGLHKTHISGLHCPGLDSAGLGWGQRAFLSNRISGDAGAGRGLNFRNYCSALSGGTVDENPPACAEDVGSIPGLEDYTCCRQVKPACPSSRLHAL